MSRKKEPDEPFQEDDSDFLPVVFARSIDQAELYRELLNDHDIPALVGTDGNIDPKASGVSRRKGMTHGVPVLVPESMLDEASEVIADREDVDEFGLADEDDLEDEEEEELDGQGHGKEDEAQEEKDGEFELDEELELDESEELDEEEDDELSDEEEGEDLLEEDEEEDKEDREEDG